MGTAKIRRTINVPNRDGKPVAIAVYSEHGPLFVTRDERLAAHEAARDDDKNYRITHEKSGLAFGYFPTLKGARGAAQELRSAIEWDKIDTSKPQPKEIGAIVFPIVHKHAGRMH